MSRSEICKALKTRVTFISTILATAALSAACAHKEGTIETQRMQKSVPSSAVVPIQASPSGLTLVTDRSLVCMVNNQYMGKPQIPITVEGKTYYGCCEMCKGRLAKDAATRVAIDPVTKKTVDKATAVIAKTESGSTLYFENEKNLARYTPPNGTSSN